MNMKIGTEELVHNVWIRWGNKKPPILSTEVGDWSQHFLPLLPLDNEGNAGTIIALNQQSAQPLQDSMMPQNLSKGE